MHGLPDHGQKTEAVKPYRRVIMIDHNAVKEPVDGLAQTAKRLHDGNKLVTGLHLRAGLRQCGERCMKSGFDIFNEQVRVGSGGKHLLGLAVFGLENTCRATLAGHKARPVITGKKNGQGRGAVGKAQNIVMTRPGAIT